MQEADKRRYLHYAAITAATLAAFGVTLSNELVSDDLAQIVANPDIHSLANLPVIFTTGIWHTDTFAGAMYRPVAFLTWMLEYSLAGASPFLYHLDNLLLHVLCSLMVYRVAGLLVRRGSAPLFAALMFAAYPTHTETVAWVACRMELLYTFFGLVSLWLFIEGKDNRSRLYLSLLLYGLALLSKEAAVSIPVLMFLYLFVLAEHGGKGRFLRSIRPLFPYVAVTAAYFALRTLVIGFGHVTSDVMENYAGMSGYEMFLLMCRAFYEYIRLAFLPFGLNAEYIFRPGSSLLSFRELLPLVVLAGAAAAAFKREASRGFRLMTFSVLWFFAALLPVSNLIATGNVIVERALYLPSFGSCLVIGLVFARASETKVVPRAGTATAVILVMVLAMFAGLSVKRNGFWSSQARIDSETVAMMRHRIEVFPGNARSHMMLAGILSSLGESGPEAESALKRAQSLEPSNPEPYRMLAELYLRRSQPEKALDELRRAISIRPEPGYYSLAGSALEGMGLYDEALAMYDRAIELRPEASDGYVDKGNMLVALGRDAEALPCFEEAARLEPGRPDAWLGMGIAQNSLGRFDDAVASIGKAVELDPSNARLHFFLGTALRDAGRAREAESEFMRSERLRNPGPPVNRIP